MTAFIAATIRPFVYLLIWGLAAGIALALRRFIPDGRIKNALYRRRK